MTDINDMQKVSAAQLKPGAKFYIEVEDGKFGSASIPTELEIDGMKCILYKKGEVHTSKWDLYKKELASLSKLRKLYIRKSQPFKHFD